MASLDSPNSPPNTSFAIRPSTDQTTTTHHYRHHHNFFHRSLSTKEPPPSSFPFNSTPPRFSTASLHTSPVSSPHRQYSFTTTTPANHHQQQQQLESSYRCVYSVLKKDGQMLSIAAFNGYVYTGSESNVIRIWKLPEFTECGQLKTKTAMVVALEVSPDRVYAAYGDGKIRVWQRTWVNHALRHIRLATIPRTGGYVRSYIIGKDKTTKHMGPITSLAINISDEILYSASLDKTVKVWRITDFKCIETIQAHSEPINALAVADDGVLYTASDDATVRAWRHNFYTENQPHTLIITLPAKCSPVKSLTLTPDDDGILYGGCSDGYVHYWYKGWFSGQLQYGGALQGHTHAVMCMASVSNYVISGSADSTSRVWSRDHHQQETGKHTIVAVLVGHRGPIRCVTAFLGRLGEDPEEEYCTIWTGSLDGVLKMWRVTRTNKNLSSGDLNQNGHEYFELQ